jgi:hypothetical protein
VLQQSDADQPGPQQRGQRGVPGAADHHPAQNGRASETALKTGKPRETIRMAESASMSGA